MESKLPNFFRRIRRTFRRRTGEVQLDYQPPKKESQPGKPLQRLPMESRSSWVEETEKIREENKLKAKTILVAMDMVEKRYPPAQILQLYSCRDLITKYGMVRMLLLIVAEKGEIPGINMGGLIQARLLTQEEVTNLMEAVPIVRLMLETLGK
ncbi:C protein [J virus]|uniref:C protein n=1 Tax=J virus TaxID=322067 RepID=Q49HN8_9MONO|nr:C protein [J virus]AAX86029.1 C protein [J virus]